MTTKILTWLERHTAWLRFDGWNTVDEVPVLRNLHAQTGKATAAEVLPEKAHRTMLFNIATSVAGAVIIGVFSGIFTAQRVVQQMSDQLKNHDSRISVIENTYVPVSVHKERDERVNAQIDSVNFRESETRTQLLTLQSEFNQFLLQRSHP